MARRYNLLPGNTRVSKYPGMGGLNRVTYRITSTVECDELAALAPEFTQSLYSIVPGRDSDRVNGVGVFDVNNREVSERPGGVPVDSVVEPVLRSSTAMVSTV